MIGTASLQMTKRSGACELLPRGKIIGGMGKACQGRLIGEDDLTRSAQLVKERIRANGASQIGTHEIGLAILEPLRELDTVAYLRFISIYSNYDSLDDFKNAVRELRENPPGSVR